MALFSPGYNPGGVGLYFGAETIWRKVSLRWESLNYTIDNIAITGNTALVTVAMSIMFDNGQPEQNWVDPRSHAGTISFGWLIKTNGQWLLYGDQQRATASVSRPGIRLASAAPYYVNLNIDGQDISSGHGERTDYSADHLVPYTQFGWQAEVSAVCNPHRSVTSIRLLSPIPMARGQTLTASVQGVVTVAPTFTAAAAFRRLFSAGTMSPPRCRMRIITTSKSTMSTGNSIWNRDTTGMFSGTFNDDESASAQLQSGATYSCSIP